MWGLLDVLACWSSRCSLQMSIVASITRQLLAHRPITAPKPSVSPTPATAPTEVLCPVELHVRRGNVVFHDKFEWEITSDESTTAGVLLYANLVRHSSVYVVAYHRNLAHTLVLFVANRLAVTSTWIHRGRLCWRAHSCPNSRSTALQ